MSTLPAVRREGKGKGTGGLGEAGLAVGVDADDFVRVTVQEAALTAPELDVLDFGTPVHSQSPSEERHQGQDGTAFSDLLLQSKGPCDGSIGRHAQESSGRLFDASLGAPKKSSPTAERTAVVQSIAARDLIVFAGNPGAGKSTLLNALIGAAEFRSGLALSGLTQALQLHSTAAGETFCDTPGLDDPELRQKAAAEIRAALQQNGDYRLFFVVALEAGRVRSADLQTISIILAAISGDVALRPGVIVNKASPQQLALYAEEANLRRLLAMLNQASGGRAIDRGDVFFHPELSELRDKTNAVVDPDPEFLRFVQSRPRTAIRQQQVEVMNIRDYDQKAAEFDALRRSFELQVRQSQQQLRKMQAELETARAERKKSQAEALWRQVELMNQLADVKNALQQEHSAGLREVVEKLEASLKDVRAQAERSKRTAEDKIAALQDALSRKRGVFAWLFGGWPW